MTSNDVFGCTISQTVVKPNDDRMYTTQSGNTHEQCFCFQIKLVYIHFHPVVDSTIETYMLASGHVSVYKEIKTTLDLMFVEDLHQALR